MSTLPFLFAFGFFMLWAYAEAKNHDLKHPPRKRR